MQIIRNVIAPIPPETYINDIAKCLDNVPRNILHFGLKFDLIKIYNNNILLFKASFITCILLTFMIIRILASWRCIHYT